MSVRLGRLVVALTIAAMPACDEGRPPNPNAPSASDSFLAGTWRGILTLEPRPDAMDAPAPIDGTTTWTFEIVPDTNLQTFRAIIQTEHVWLPIDTVATTAIIPANTPPAQISTQGDYRSPRGCRGSFASFGVADATRIDADFTGADCDRVTFTGRVFLMKQ